MLNVNCNWKIKFKLKKEWYRKFQCVFPSITQMLNFIIFTLSLIFSSCIIWGKLQKWHPFATTFFHVPQWFGSTNCWLGAYPNPPTLTGQRILMPLSLGFRISIRLQQLLTGTSPWEFGAASGVPWHKEGSNYCPPSVPWLSNAFWHQSCSSI